MTTEHTPGPWDEGYKAQFEILVGSLQRVVARIPMDALSDDEAEANAVLIRNAPKMLSVLKALSPDQPLALELLTEMGVNQC